MNDPTRRSWPLIAMALFVLPLRAQDDDKKKEQDPEIEQKLEVFEDAIEDRKFERDQEAVKIIDELLQKQKAGLHVKDEKDVVDALASVFRQRPRKPEQPQLYEATVAALGEIGGSRAAQVLKKVAEDKPFDDDEWLAFREKIYEAIGKTKEERQVKDFLVKAATQSPIDGVKRAAGKALRHFEDADLKVRQDIFKDLLTNYGTIYGGAHDNLDPGDAVRQTRAATLKAIADPWNQTLAALSGQSFRTAPEWYEWWNDNKNDRKAWK